MTDSMTGTDRRSMVVLASVLGASLAAFVILAVLGHYTFVFKVLVVPVLFIVALATRRLKLFVNEWAVFLGMIALFDTLRGLIFMVTMQSNRTVFMNYAIDAEKLLGFGKLPTLELQKWLSDGMTVGPLEKFLVVVHGSHFLFFLGFALLVWYVRRADFDRFQVGMLLVMYVGLLFYFLVPTVPPWMAANQYQAIEPIFHFPEVIYNTTLPKLFGVFDTNPIAAMPSLHTAFPVYCCCVAFALFGRRAIPLLVYTVVAVFALVYAGEHYLVDSLAGAALAIGAWIVTHRFGPLAKRLRKADDKASDAPRPFVSRRLIVGVVVLAAALVGGNLMADGKVKHVTTRAFVERELADRSTSAHYYRALLHEEDKQLRRAQQEYEAARAEMGDEAPLSLALLLRLGVAAHTNGDHSTAIDALGTFPIGKLGAIDAAMLGVSMLESGLKGESVMYFQTLQQQRPGEPVSLYWLTRILALDLKIPALEVRQNAATIRANTSNPGILRLADQLDMIASRMP